MAKQSLIAFCIKNVKLEYEHSDKCIVNGGTGWTVTLTYKGRTITTPYSMGAAKDFVVTADVLNCLVKDAEIGEYTYNDFKSEFGSTKMDIWLECQKVAERLRVFLGSEYKMVQEICVNY